MTRAQVERLIGVFRSHEHAGLAVALEAVANVACTMSGDVDDTRTPLTAATVMAAKLVISRTAASHGLKVERLLQSHGEGVDGQCDYVSACRQEIYFRLRAMRFSYPTIGKLLKRTHQPVIAGCRRFERLHPALAAEIRGDALKVRESVYPVLQHEVAAEPERRAA